MKPSPAELAVLPPTDAELDTLFRYAESGEKLAKVAHEMGISRSTAKRRLRRLQLKLGVDTNLQALALYARRGLSQKDS